MRHRIWHKAVVAMCGALFLFVANVPAVSLEKAEVASHLGETLHAVIPLKLEANELASKVFVDIASPADYKVFEVYRDPVVDAIRADVASDERGVRVELTSRSSMQTPFFNVILKIRYGRVSHFKKFPVFIDSKKTVQRAAQQPPQPTVQAVAAAPVAHSAATGSKAGIQAAVQNGLTKSAGQTIMPKQQPGDAQPARQPQYFDGWARTGRYGPIVRGDTLSTVAKRLRVDKRYSLNQVMIGLFAKNPGSFKRDNLNLLKAGSFLQVPSAVEVESHSKAEAKRLLSKHAKAWQQLSKQPPYAGEALAQRNRYKKHISMGEQASGRAAAPSPIVEQKPVAAAHTRAALAAVAPAVAAEQTAAQRAKTAQASAQVEQVMEAQNKTNALLARLQEENKKLQQQVLENQKIFASLNKKLDSASGAAATAGMQKLEIMLARLEAAQEKSRSQPAAAAEAGQDWVVLLLIALVVIMLGVIVLLMRREPAHPAASAAETGHEHVNLEQSESQYDDVLGDPAVADSEALEAAIEDEIADLEVAQSGSSKRPGSGGQGHSDDTLPSFDDELSDTDTAELEPLQSAADIKPDASIDYLSEAEVYMRYGMEEEALQQLELALQLQPDNVQAHIKKAELLLGKQDKQAFDQTMAAATLVLDPSDLDQLKFSLQELDADIAPQSHDQAAAAAPEEQYDDAVDAQSPDTVSLDESEVGAIDFNIPDADSTAVVTEQIEDELGWLQDSSFTDVELDDDLAAEVETAPETLESRQDANGGATQELDSLLSEFADEQLDDELLSAGLDAADVSIAAADGSAAIDTAAVQQPADALELNDGLSGATSELGHLLGEFADVDTHSDAAIDNKPAGDVQSEEQMGATQHLDMLLSEFEDDELDFSATAEPEIDQALIAQGQEDSALAAAEPIAIDANQLATQELDSLLSEFSTADSDPATDAVSSDALDASFFQPETQADAANDITLDGDFGATQELDSLLGEFAELGDEAGQLEMDSDQAGLDAESIEQRKAEESTEAWEGLENGATQVLGHLLEEFNDDDKDDKKKS